MGIPRRGKDKENPVYKALQMGTIPSKVLLDKATESTATLNERTNERHKYQWEFEKLTATGRFSKSVRKSTVHGITSNEVICLANGTSESLEYSARQSAKRRSDGSSAEEGEYP